MTVRFRAAGLVTAATLLLAALASAAPKAKIEPMEIDLGLIKEGNEFERFLDVTNVGDGVLVLEDIKTSCGCTAAAVDGAVELGAGESQQIRISFNSKNMDGDITKRITVATNDPETPHTQVQLKATVHRAVRWTPKYVSLDEVRAKDGVEKTITLEVDTELGAEVLGAEVVGGRTQDQPSELFAVEVGEKRTEGARDKWDFTVRLDESAKPQKLSEFLQVGTNLPGEQERLRIPIRGRIVGRIRVYPEYAVMPITDPGEESVKNVALTADEGTFEVTKAFVENSPIEVDVVRKDGGKQTVLELHYVGEEPGANGVRTLKIATDDPEQPSIEIPVRYQTRVPKKQQG